MATAGGAQGGGRGSGSTPSTPSTSASNNQQNSNSQNQQNQTPQNQPTPTSQANVQDFSTNQDSGIEIQAVNPPLTPDQIIGIYETPFNKSYSYNPFALPTLKLDSVKSSNIKNKTIQEHLKSIEAKMISTEKLMKNIIKLQNLNILTEKEVSQRKTELYQNTFEEYILDKSIDFGKKKKSCTCINLPENLPPTAGAPVTPPGPPGPPKNPIKDKVKDPVKDPLKQPVKVPQTQGTPDTAPSPKPGFQLPDWLNPKNLPRPQNPFPDGIPIPPFPRLPDVEGLPGFAAAKNLVTPKNLAILGSVIGAGAMMRGSQVQAITPFESEVFNKSSSLFSAPDAGVPTAAPMLANASGRIINYAKGGMTNDLELYNSESQNYFKKISNQIASDIPVGPHTPLPHPGYVRPQGGYIPRPNLRGMPNPMGKPMPWGWQPTLLAKGGFVKPYAGGGFLNQLGKFLPGTGTVMAPKGMSLGFQDKLLGIPLGRREIPLNKTYKQEDVNRYNRTPTAPSNITTFGGDGPLSNRHISIPKTKFSSPIKPSSTITRTESNSSRNQRLDAAIKNARDITNIPGAKRYKPLVESAASTAIKKQEYYDKLREAMRQSGMSGADKSMRLNGTPISSANIEPVSTSNNKVTRLEQTQSNLMASNQTAAPKMIPLPPDYIKIPGSKKKETNDDTMAPPPSINPPSSIFSRARSTVS